MTSSVVITSVLVANRGEIARRVFASCRRMGIATVAVYSDPDAGAPHVAEADSAVRLPGETSAETYLDGAAIVAAAQAAGADAIHPGYGFLSENADFARQVVDAGLTWLGPSPEAITAMGSKVNAKEIMAAAGVPVLGDLDPETITAQQLPVLIKASAGGGGRGMRIVRELSELSDQVAAARREAESAFGDPTVFCEPYIEKGHHIEVQVLADAHGTVWAVGERECSIQRRHQKVIEEAPAPLVERIGPALRDELFAASRAAAKAIDYRGAGTVEFLADDDGRFYFLEMNTRLQVEHPVTEETTGLDLVAWQLQIAEGAALGAEPTGADGHSIEVRLYAEDPSRDYAPQSGTVHRIDIASDAQFDKLSRPGIRLDSGLVDGQEISVFYDPMLAKVISWSPTRGRAAAMLARALTDARIHAPVTNRDMLIRMLRHPEFLSGNTDTAFIDRHGLAELSQPLLDESETRLSVIAAALADAAANRDAATTLSGLPAGWRNLAAEYAVKKFRPSTAAADDEATEVAVRYRFTRTGVELPDDPDVTVGSVTADEVALTCNGVRRTIAVARYPDRSGDTIVYTDQPTGSAVWHRIPRFVDPSTLTAPGSLLAPMPGSVTRIAVELGQQVSAGEPLLWLEAMKMEHTISAPADGVVAELPVTVGKQVGVGEMLAVIAEPTD